jgi:hypothetical protein
MSNKHSINNRHARVGKHMKVYINSKAILESEDIKIFSGQRSISSSYSIGCMKLRIFLITALTSAKKFVPLGQIYHNSFPH